MSDGTERVLKPFFHHTLHSSMGGNLPAEAHLANQLLSGKIPSERVAALATFLLEAARWGNERVAMQAFRWLEQAWDEWAEAYRKEYTGHGDKTFFESLRANILERCIELYAAIPEDDEGYPTCPDVKVGIIQKVARTYWEAEWTDTSIKAFAFILAMGYPVGKGNPAQGLYADVRLRFAEKKAHQKETMAVEAAIREKLGQWKVADIERWFMDWNNPTVPSTIRDLFAIARGRNGGRVLMQGDLEARALVRSLDHEKRSPAALAAHNEFCLKLAAFDKKFRDNSFIGHGAWSLAGEAPGKSTSMYGSIICRYAITLDMMEADVTCPREMSAELLADMPRRLEQQLQWAWGLMDSQVTMKFRVFDSAAVLISECSRERISNEAAPAE